MYKYNEQKFKNDDQRVSYYTGLACFKALMALFNLAEAAIKKVKLLNPFEKFILCMMWLHLGNSVINLTDRLLISKTTAADTFLYLVFNIAAIIDCLERFIARSTYSTGPSFTQSNHESHNGGKYLINIAPEGTIFFYF